MSRDDAQSGSKSAAKRAHRALQELGIALMQLSPALLERIPLAPSVREAVEFGRSLSKGARARHVRHLGNQLARSDVDTVLEALERVTGASRAETARQHRVERWRERLLEEGDEVIGELLGTYPCAETQVLRGFIRGVRRERGRGAAPRQYRELFRYLRQLDEAQD